MKTKLSQSVPLVLIVFCIALAFFADWCFKALSFCYGSWFDQIYFPFTQPLYDFCVPVIVLGIVLLFVSAPIFRSWLKFATWTLPLAFVWIALTPVSWTGLGIDFFPYYRINAAHDAGVAFVIASIVFLVWKYFKKSRETRIS